jgi:hypothetical protein
MSVVPVILSGRQAFDPRATLFAHNEPGAWYDPSDLGTMFTTSDGTTPVTGVEQAVGLILDKSRGLAIGGELVTNGSFAVDANWVKEAGWAISGGQAVATATSASIYQNSVVTSGKTYFITIAVASVTAGSVRVRISSLQLSQAITAAGTYTMRLSATGTGSLDIVGTGFSGAIDEISVREIAGTHAIQPSSASRPVLRNRYNLLTFSEQFNDAAWTKANVIVTANAVVAPDGTTTADKLDFGGTTESDRCFQDAAFNAQNGTAITGTVWLRADTPCTLKISVQRSGPADNEEITASVTTSWQLFTVSHTSTWTGTTALRLSLNTISSVGYVYAWGADLRRPNDTIYPYQRIEAATVYDSDTSKFPLYLALDGSDDSLYTAANLDLSSTDKVTVFAGVTKLSDGATGILAETSADYGSNNGTFAMGQPWTTLSRDGFGARGTSDNSVINANAAPATQVITGIASISGPLTELRRNGASVVSSTTTLGTGNFGSYLLNIGRRNNASLPFNGRIHQLIVRGAASSAAEISSAERYIAGKQGRAL